MPYHCLCQRCAEPSLKHTEIKSSAPPAPIPDEWRKVADAFRDRWATDDGRALSVSATRSGVGKSAGCRTACWWRLLGVGSKNTRDQNFSRRPADVTDDWEVTGQCPADFYPMRLRRRAKNLSES